MLLIKWNIVFHYLPFINTAAHVEPNSMSHDPLDLKGAPVNEEGGGMADPALEDIDFDRGSVSSDDSFHSTLESLDDEDVR